MKKSYLITMGVSFLVIVSAFVILLMILLPQQVQLMTGNINEYEAITKSRYTFESKKDFSSESLKKQYSITNEDMSHFEATNQYNAGNSDPFTPSSSSGPSTSTSGNTLNDVQSTVDKTTNSNNGQKNPSNTIK